MNLWEGRWNLRIMEVRYEEMSEMRAHTVKFVDKYLCVRYEEMSEMRQGS